MNNLDVMGNRTNTVSTGFGVNQPTDVRTGSRREQRQGQGSNITDSTSKIGEYNFKQRILSVLSVRLYQYCIGKKNIEYHNHQKEILQCFLVPLKNEMSFIQ